MAKRSSTKTKATRTKTATKSNGRASAAKSTRKPASRATAVRRTATAKKEAPKAEPKVIMMMSHDQIAERAYHIWLKKGRPTGCDEDNWIEAEKELAETVAADE